MVQGVLVPRALQPDGPQPSFAGPAAPTAGRLRRSIVRLLAAEAEKRRPDADPGLRRGLPAGNAVRRGADRIRRR